MASSGACPACDGSYRLDVMGSQPKPLGAVAPQQLPPPDFTRNAAWPYFSLTTFLMSLVLILLLFTKLDDILGFYRLISSAAFRVQELQQLLERFRIGGVSQKRALAADVHKLFVP